jgi:hypothetical protein
MCRKSLTGRELEEHAHNNTRANCAATHDLAIRESLRNQAIDRDPIC